MAAELRVSRVADRPAGHDLRGHRRGHRRAADGAHDPLPAQVAHDRAARGVRAREPCSARSRRRYELLVGARILGGAAHGLFWAVTGAVRIAARAAAAARPRDLGDRRRRHGGVRPRRSARHGARTRPRLAARVRRGRRGGAGVPCPGACCFLPPVHIGAARHRRDRGAAPARSHAPGDGDRLHQRDAADHRAEHLSHLHRPVADPGRARSPPDAVSGLLFVYGAAGAIGLVAAGWSATAGRAPPCAACRRRGRSASQRSPSSGRFDPGDRRRRDRMGHLLRRAPLPDPGPDAAVGLAADARHRVGLAHDRVQHRDRLGALVGGFVLDGLGIAVLPYALLACVVLALAFILVTDGSAWPRTSRSPRTSRRVPSVRCHVPV